MTEDFDIEKFRLRDTGSIKEVPTVDLRKGKFIKGPIPANWMAEVYKLPASAIKIGLALWYVSGLKKSTTFRLTTKQLEDFYIDRQTKYRGLQHLEKAGLIEVKSQAGKNPTVTLITKKLSKLIKIIILYVHQFAGCLVRIEISGGLTGNTLKMAFHILKIV